MSRDVEKVGTRDKGPILLVLRGFRWVISLALALVGGILFFLGISMLMIFLVDSTIFHQSQYINWLPNVYIPVIASILCFFVFALLNIDRFKAFGAISHRFKVDHVPKKIEEIDLD